jgi:flagellar biosynthetic protein FlhB
MRMMSNVKKADVVIINPTHLAVAVRYDPDSMRAPILLAKGAHLIAHRIADIARSNNIPVIQNIPLARAMYQTVNIDQEIPSELYLAMAEVLSYVYKLRGTSPISAEA